MSWCRHLDRHDHSHSQAIDKAIAAGVEEAGRRKWQPPSDLSYSIKPFFKSIKARRFSNGSSSHGEEIEKVLVTFTTPAAAGFVLRQKKQMGDDVYAAPLLTSKEQAAKHSRSAEFRTLKKSGRPVTWHRAKLVEFVREVKSGAATWRVFAGGNSRGGGQGASVSTTVGGGQPCGPAKLGFTGGARV